MSYLSNPALANNAAFLEDLKEFHNARLNTPLKIPKAGGKDLDLYKLLITVLKYGGFEAVTVKKLWREIGREIDLPTTVTNSPFVLKMYYAKILIEYELVNYFGRPLASIPHQDWTKNLKDANDIAAAIATATGRPPPYPGEEVILESPAPLPAGQQFHDWKTHPPLPSKSVGSRLPGLFPLSSSSITGSGVGSGSGFGFGFGSGVGSLSSSTPYNNNAANSSYYHHDSRSSSPVGFGMDTMDIGGISGSYSHFLPSSSSLSLSSSSSEPGDKLIFISSTHRQQQQAQQQQAQQQQQQRKRLKLSSKTVTYLAANPGLVQEEQNKGLISVFDNYQSKDYLLSHSSASASTSTSASAAAATSSSGLSSNSLSDSSPTIVRKPTALHPSDLKKSHQTQHHHHHHHQQQQQQQQQQPSLGSNKPTVYQPLYESDFEGKILSYSDLHVNDKDGCRARVLRSLHSTLPNEIDWAFNTLVAMSYEEPETTEDICPANFKGIVQAVLEHTKFFLLPKEKSDGGSDGGDQLTEKISDSLKSESSTTSLVGKGQESNDGERVNENGTENGTVANGNANENGNENGNGNENETRKTNTAAAEESLLLLPYVDHEVEADLELRYENRRKLPQELVKSKLNKTNGVLFSTANVSIDNGRWKEPSLSHSGLVSNSGSNYTSNNNNNNNQKLLTAIQNERVSQTLLILRNWFCDIINVISIASSTPTFDSLFDFLESCLKAPCKHEWHVSARDIIKNLCQVVKLAEHSRFARFLKTDLWNGLFSNDRNLVIYSLDSIASLCGVEFGANTEFILALCSYKPLIQQIVSFLTIPDVPILLSALETLYQLSKFDKEINYMIASAPGAVKLLVSFINFDYESFDDVKLASNMSNGGLITPTSDVEMSVIEQAAVQWIRSTYRHTSSESFVSFNVIYNEYVAKTRAQQQAILNPQAFAKLLKFTLNTTCTRKIGDTGVLERFFIGIRRSQKNEETATTKKEAFTKIPNLNGHTTRLQSILVKEGGVGGGGFESTHSMVTQEPIASSICLSASLVLRNLAGNSGNYQVLAPFIHEFIENAMTETAFSNVLLNLLGDVELTAPSQVV